jgi:hypothetical protein
MGSEKVPVQLISLQPVAIVDHLCVLRDEGELKQLIGQDEVGGSHRVELTDVQQLLSNVGEYFSKAGRPGACRGRGGSRWGEWLCRHRSRCRRHRRPLVREARRAGRQHQISSRAGSIYTQCNLLPFPCAAGGSAANTTRGLAGFGVSTQLLGVRGSDEVRSSACACLPCLHACMCRSSPPPCGDKQKNRSILQPPALQ